MTDNIVIMITCSSKREAGKIKKKLLEAKKVACVNIISGVDSFFWWKDKIDSCPEVLLLAKTKKNLLKKIILLVKKIHKYEVPEIIALPIIDGNRDYLDWIEKSVS
jgi:periplasmic divalent cation tolerance protein